MILLSRLVTRLLRVGLLAIFVLGVTTECSADGFASHAIFAVSHAEAEPLHWPDIQTEYRPPNNCGNQWSNFAITEQWCRFTFPETYRVASSMVDQAKSAIGEVQQLQDSQRDWAREKLDLVVDRCHEILDPLVSTWLASQKSAKVPVANLAEDQNTSSVAQALTALSPTALSPTVQSLILEASEESTYWSYYQDCQRWSVELTRTVRQHQLKQFQSKESLTAAQNVDAGNEKTVRPRLLSDQLSQNFATMSDVINRTAQWLGQTLRQIEFAVIESSASASRDILPPLYW